MSLPTLDLSVILGAALVVLGLGVYGFKDLVRFSPGRTWAVGGVVFRESIRRRVWLIPPLAMLAVLLLRQLQNPADEADAVRQTLTYCLFASGLVVVAVTLILACTNLPREIDSRVIFTIVTKPLTRLELFAGKVLGFARLNAVLLVVMGLFTWGLLAWMNLTLLNGIRERLAGTVEESRRPYLQHLLDVGLLRSDRVAVAEDLQVYALPPDAAADAGAAPRWIYPLEQYFAVPFQLPADLAGDAAANDSSAPASDYGPRLAVQMRLPWRRMEQRPLPAEDGSTDGSTDGSAVAPPPVVSVQILDHALYNVIGPSSILDNVAELPAEPSVDWAGAAVIRLSDTQSRRVFQEPAGVPVYVGVYVNNAEYLLGALPDSVRLVVERPAAPPDGVSPDGVSPDGVSPDGVLPPTYEPAEIIEPDLKGDSRGNLLARTYLGSNGVGLAGPTSDLPPPLGVLAFRGADSPGVDGRLGFDVRLRVDATGDVSDLPDETLVRAQLFNLETGALGEPVEVVAATGQETFFSVPAELAEGGDFDLRLQNTTRGQIVSARGDSLRLVVGSQPFAWNLAKALCVQWLLGVLVATAGLAFSTFVGWPIAVTMTVVMLGGRWVAEQLGGALSGAGRQTAEAVFGSGGDVSAKEAVRVGVDTLNDAFAAVTQFLPNVDVYGVGGALEQGLVLPPAAVGHALLVTLAFALPLTALAYVVLRNKEVAP